VSRAAGTSVSSRAAVLIGAALAALSLVACGALFGSADDAPPPARADAALPDAADVADASVADAEPDGAPDAEADADAARPQGPRVVFVTVSFVHADDGVAAFTTICNQESPSALRTFVPWVSSSATGTNAIDTLPDGAEYFVVSTDGGVGPAFATKSEIASSIDPHATLTRNGKGSPVTPGDSIFTGTDKNGQKTGNDCGGWSTQGNGSASVGQVGGSAVNWTRTTDTNCAGQAHLICFEK
jgi:hypothetical protein